MNANAKTSMVLMALVAAFAMLAGAFHLNLWGRPARFPQLPLVDTNFLSTATARVSAAELFATPGADTSDFDCYACHEKNKAPPMRFDAVGNIIIPSEHKDIVMGHGSHGRNNNCFNCHNETRLDTLQSRDGRELSITNSPSLCGSC